MSTHSATVYVTLRAERIGGTHGKVRGIAGVKLTQSRPGTLGRDQLAVRLVLTLDDDAWEPLSADSPILVPTSSIVRAVTAEGGVLDATPSAEAVRSEAAAELRRSVVDVELPWS